MTKHSVVKPVVKPGSQVQIKENGDPPIYINVTKWPKPAANSGSIPSYGPDNDFIRAIIGEHADPKRKIYYLTDAGQMASIQVLWVKDY